MAFWIIIGCRFIGFIFFWGVIGSLLEEEDVGGFWDWGGGVDCVIWIVLKVIYCWGVVGLVFSICFFVGWIIIGGVWSRVVEERLLGTLVFTIIVFEEVMIGVRGGIGGGVWLSLIVILGVELGVFGLILYIGGIFLVVEVRGEVLFDRWFGFEGVLLYLDLKLGFFLIGFEYGLIIEKDIRYKFWVEIIFFLKYLFNYKEDSVELCVIF